MGEWSKSCFKDCLQQSVIKVRAVSSDGRAIACRSKGMGFMSCPDCMRIFFVIVVLLPSAYDIILI